MSERFDAAVIGAGMAGLAAAKLLARAGKTTILLEASARSGGRVVTLKSDTGTAIELGPEFVHGKAEPIFSLAREAGVELVSIADRHFQKSGGRFAELKHAWQPPGGIGAAQALSAPFWGMLFIAGEATDHEYPGTVAGALASGARAARQALQALQG